MDYVYDFRTSLVSHGNKLMRFIPLIRPIHEKSVISKTQTCQQNHMKISNRMWKF